MKDLTHLNCLLLKTKNLLLLNLVKIIFLIQNGIFQNQKSKVNLIFAISLIYEEKITKEKIRDFFEKEYK